MIKITKFTVTAVVALILAAAAGESRSENPPSPEPRPLGGRFTAYTAPESPPDRITDELAASEPAGPLTLDDALSLALARNPLLIAHAWEMRSAEAHRTQQGAFPNPGLEVEVADIGGTGDRARLDAAETTVLIEQELEIPGKRSSRKRAASMEVDLAGWDYEAARLDLITDVTRRFVATLAAQERLRLANEIVLVQEKTLATVGMRVDAGKDPPIEKTRASVSLSAARIGLGQAERDLQSARHRLAETWGAWNPLFERVEGDLGKVMSPPSLASLIALVEQNPDIARWRAEKAYREARIDMEASAAIPNPTLFGGYKHFHVEDGHAYILGLSIPLPLFDRNRGALSEAKYNLARSEAENRAAEAGAHAALAAAYHEITETFSTVGTLRTEILPGAEEAFHITLEGYRDGKFPYLMVLDAQRTLFEAMGSYTAALEAYHISRAELERLIGSDLGSLTGAEER